MNTIIDYNMGLVKYEIRYSHITWQANFWQKIRLYFPNEHDGKNCEVFYK